MMPVSSLELKDTERRIGRPQPRSLTRTQLLILFILLAIGTLLFARFRPSGRYNYDESDYMFVASKGLGANYFDIPSLSLSAFVKRGIEDGLHPSRWPQLSDFVRNSQELALYRHYHGPLNTYLLIAAKPLFGATEKSMRWVPFFCLLLGAAVMYLGSLFLVEEHALTVALLAAACLLLSPTNLQTAMRLTPHTVYVVTMLATLFLLAKWVQSADLRFLYATAAALAIAVTAIEYAALLLVTVVITVYLNRGLLFPRGSFRSAIPKVARCVAIFLIALAALWLGGLSKLTLLKNYMFFAYFATVRSASYGTESVAQVWWVRITSSPVEYTVLLLSTILFVYALVRHKVQKYLIPFAVYASLMFLTTVRNHSTLPAYFSSFQPPLYFISAVMLSRAAYSRSVLQRCVFALIAAGLGVNGFFYAYRPLAQMPPDERTNGVVAVLKGRHVQAEDLLIPHSVWPVIHYYFPSSGLSQSNHY